MDKDILLAFNGGTRLSGGDFAITRTEQERLMREMNIILRSGIGDSLFKGVSLSRFIGLPMSDKFFSLLTTDVKHYLNDLISDKSYNFDVVLTAIGKQSIEISIKELSSGEKITLSTFNIGTGDIVQPADPFDVEKEVIEEVGRYKSITNKYIKRNNNFGTTY